MGKKKKSQKLKLKKGNLDSPSYPSLVRREDDSAKIQYEDKKQTH
jgi:hypothetical protein